MCPRCVPRFEHRAEVPGMRGRAPSPAPRSGSPRALAGGQATGSGGRAAPISQRCARSVHARRRLGAHAVVAVRGRTRVAGIRRPAKPRIWLPRVRAAAGADATNAAGATPDASGALARGQAPRARGGASSDSQRRARSVHRLLSFGPEGVVALRSRARVAGGPPQPQPGDRLPGVRPRARRVTAERSLPARHPELVAELHPTRNGELDPYVEAVEHPPEGNTSAAGRVGT